MRSGQNGYQAIDTFRKHGNEEIMPFVCESKWEKRRIDQINWSTHGDSEFATNERIIQSSHLLNRIGKFLWEHVRWNLVLPTIFIYELFLWAHMSWVSKVQPREADWNWAEQIIQKFASIFFIADWRIVAGDAQGYSVLEKKQIVWRVK